MKTEELDDELKLIKQIYDNFSKHPLPVQTKKMTHNKFKEKDTYTKFENKKMLFKDEFYINQPSEITKKQEIDKFYQTRGVNNREKYLAFVK